ncbi:MAG: protein-L-isoaspartate(D-aspartate) O-methyltransferase [Planctomycetota bacterium]
MFQSAGSFGSSGSTGNAVTLARDPFAAARRKLVETKIRTAGVTNPRVLSSIAQTPRHEFVPASVRGQAYFDMALPIGSAQTISSPFIVAWMTEVIDPQPDDRVLEIGTGSGYQAAVLSPLVAEVYSIEIVPELGQRAARVLNRLDYENVQTRIGDGFLGWPEAAPFDKIIVTCSPESVPKPLADQLNEGGVMIIPVGQRYQQTFYEMKKVDGELVRQPLRPTLFVPMTGTAEAKRVRLPDATQPQLINGSFEVASAADDPEGFIPGWYYGRQVMRVAIGDGRHVARFSNETPGLSSHLLQGIAIDGQAVSMIRFSGRVRTQSIEKGPDADAIPAIAISYYDEQRRMLQTVTLGPYRGTRDWREDSRLLRVPPTTKEAIIRLGLFGATGVAEFDDIRLQVLP